MTSTAYNNESPQTRRRTELTAAAITLLLTLGIGLCIALLKLTYTSVSATQTWPPADSSEILFEGEYVMAGDVDQPQASASEPAAQAAVEEPVTDGTALRDAGEPAPAPVTPVASTQPSPMKVTPPTAEPKGPAKPANAAQNPDAKAQNETQQKIAGQMKFGSNSSKGSGEGKTGSPDGNAAEGKISGTPGYSLEGRTLAHWERPAKTAPNGVVTLRVVVNRQGEVIDATVKSSSGAAASEAVRQACIAAAKKSRFSVKLDAAVRQSGTISYRFVAK